MILHALAARRQERLEVQAGTPDLKRHAVVR
jgi:hypothetical protein